MEKGSKQTASPSWYTGETADHNTIASDIDTVKASNVNPARRVTVSEHQVTVAPIVHDEYQVLLSAAHTLISLQLSPTKIMANDSDLEEDVQGYLDESDIELNEDEMALLMWLCIGVQRRPGSNSSFFVRHVIVISVDTLRAEHAESLYTLVTRDRGEDNEQGKHKSPSTISSKTSSSRSEVIPLDFSGLNLDEMPDPPQLFNDAGSSIVIAMESDSLATADTADTTKSGQPVLSDFGCLVS